MASPEAASKTEPISERATSGAKTMGTRWVGTRRAPRRRRVRRAASLPIDSGDSRSAKPARAGPPAIALHLAVGVHGQGRSGDAGVAGAVAADKAARVGQHLAAGGGVKAAAVGVGDARIGGQRGCLGAARPLDALRARERVDIVIVEVQIAATEPNSAVSGKPLKGSSSVTLASAIAPSTSWRMPSAVRSLVEVEAERVPRKTRRPSPREPDSFSVSTSPMRTLTLNSSPSRTTASASLAPAFMARATTSAVRDSRSSVVWSVWVAAAVMGQQ